MAKSVAGIQDLLTKLKKDAGPWNKDTHEIVEKITAALGKLMPMSMPPESVTNQVVQLLRHLMSKLYDPFTTVSLQLAVATFGFITNEKIVHAIKDKSLKKRMQWETIAEAVLDGVLDYLDLVDQKEEAGLSTKAKEAVSQAFYTTICSIFFPSDSAVPSQSFSVKLRALAYSILFSTCDGIPKNIEKLRNSKVLGSERLGRVIAKTKDYVALEQLLDLLARLIPPTNNTAKGRASRKLFIEEVFINGGSDAIPGDDIVKLLEFINSSEWEETSAKIVDILGRDISFPQPFKVKAIEISDTTFKLRASDRFYVDRNYFLVNNWNEYEEEEAIKIQYSSLRQVKVNDTGAVQIMTSSPATIGDKDMARLTDDQPVLINFIVGRTDFERFVSAVGARGLGRLVQKNGRTIKNSTARISTIPGQLAFSEEDKTLSQPLSFVEKVKVVKTRGEISERSDDNATFPNPLDGGAHDESPLPDTGLSTTADGGRTSRTAAPAGRARGKTHDPSRNGRADPAVAHDGLPDISASRTGHAPEPAQHNPAALPPVRARPAPRPAGRAARAAPPDPVRAGPDGLPSSPPWDAPNARTRSQKMHDAVFGTDDEELSDVSDRELEGRPRSPAVFWTLHSISSISSVCPVSAAARCGRLCLLPWFAGVV
ncbi:hypothetical protein EWM64_g5922 [Hericium alpestre]|uniref:Uncharacterized protein n=1 Tax=Hericium alpestre TaxID=135208 RepID=A0A4Y9ZVA5_9AGAM|nr:hypothetical protein EWM64_g5922 [Hericium alpestre]